MTSTQDFTHAWERRELDLIDVMNSWNMHSLEYSFCPAMLCKRGLCRHAVSVYLSVRPSRSWTLSKRINTSSKNFRHRVATPFWFFCTKRYNNIPTATSLAVASNAGRVGTNLDCGRIAGFRSMTVAMRDQQLTVVGAVVYKLWCMSVYGRDRHTSVNTPKRGEQNRI